MRGSRPDRVELRLRGILSRIGRISRAIDNVDYAAFVESETVYDAVERNIELIGDAVRKLPPDLLAAAPGMPWEQIGGMKNVLAHDYDDMIDASIVWDVANRRLPELKATIEALLTRWRSMRPEIR